MVSRIKMFEVGSLRVDMGNPGLYSLTYPRVWYTYRGGWGGDENAKGNEQRREFSMTRQRNKDRDALANKWVVVGRHP